MNNTNTKKIYIIKGILSTMSRGERRRLVLLSVMGVLRSVAETVSTGAVLPYMYVLIDTEKASTLPLLRGFYASAGGNTLKFILSATLLFLGCYAFRCLYLVFYDYVDGRIIRRISSDYSVGLFRYYMTRPYEFFFSKNSAILQRNVSTVVLDLIQGVISNSLYLFSYGLTVALLLAVMVASRIPGLLIAAAMLAVLYLALSRNVKKRAKEIAKLANTHSKTLHKSVTECFRGIKDVMLGAEESNISSFIRNEYDEYNSLRVKRNLLNSIPNQILELGTLTVLSVILISGYRSSGMEQSLATLSMCGACAIRIRSALYGILTKITAIKDNSAYYEEVIDDIRASRSLERSEEKCEPITFSDKIEIRDLSYHYPGAEKNVLSGFNLTIYKGETLGITGPSGRGKSTLADLVTGLISPTEGEILIDSESLAGREVAWRRLVGYVPQDIFLIDGTILENVAFFEPKDKIDTDRVRKALKTAQILDYVDTLPQRENSRIGDNGILLSGGQRQRIGIARALYRSPEVLLFDETTNSLDSDTERAFLETIGTLKKDYTMIVISHRKETLGRCDRVADLSAE